MEDFRQLVDRASERFGRAPSRAKEGPVFIVCATGKTAREMLDRRRRRRHNDPPEELALTAEEQRKITRLHLKTLLGHRPRVSR
jgi:2-oxo-4-hydroxy-4-carboxy-5-ureidoimidazoline decarboxylase